MAKVDFKTTEKIVQPIPKPAPALGHIKAILIRAHSWNAWNTVVVHHFNSQTASCECVCVMTEWKMRRKIEETARPTAKHLKMNTITINVYVKHMFSLEPYHYHLFSSFATHIHIYALKSSLQRIDRRFWMETEQNRKRTRKSETN